MIKFKQFYREFLTESAQGFTQYTFKVRDRDAYLQNENVQQALNYLSSQGGLRILSLPYGFAFEKQLMKNNYKVAAIIGLEAVLKNLRNVVQPAAVKLSREGKGPKIYLRNKTIDTKKLQSNFENKIFNNVMDSRDRKSVKDLSPNLIDLDYVGMYGGYRRSELLQYGELLQPGGLLFVTYSVRPHSGSGVKTVADLQMPAGDDLEEIKRVMPSQELNVDQLKADLSNERMRKIKNIIPADDEFQNKIGVLKEIIKRLESNKKTSAGVKERDFSKYTPFGVNITDKYESLDIFYKVANKVKEELNGFKLLYANVYRGGDTKSATSMVRLVLQKNSNNANEKYSNSIIGQHLIKEDRSASGSKAWLHGDIKRIILQGWAQEEVDGVRYNGIIEELQSYAADENISIEEVVLPFLKKLLQKVTDKKTINSNAPAALQQQKPKIKNNAPAALQQKHIFETDANELKENVIFLLPDPKKINDFLSYVKAERFANPTAEFSKFLKERGDTLYYGRRSGERGTVVTVSKDIVAAVLEDDRIKSFKLTAIN